MIRSVKILAVAAAVLMAAPAAMATWMGYGTFEPDVIEDVQGGWMFADPPSGDAKQVYFNVIGGSMGGLHLWSPTPNHNVGAAQTRFAPTNEIYKAFLGVWNDCNEDGYVGLAETAVHAYRVELGEHNEAVCPVESSPTSHNDGTWIRELIPIGHSADGTGYDEENDTIDQAVYVDDTAMIWGDAGYPGEDLAETGSGGTCPVSPWPKGSMQSTGALLNFIDCGVGTINLVNFAIANVEEESGQDTGLGFETEPWNEEGSPLDQPTLGSEDSEERAFTVWDCSGETVNQTVSLPIEDPSGAIDDTPGDGETQLATIAIPALAPGTGPGSSFAGANNHTLEGILGDCDTSNDAGGDTYLLEGENEGTSTTNKVAAGWNFAFRRAAYHPGYEVLGPDVFEDGDNLNPVPVTLPSTGASDLGIALAQGFAGTYWSSDFITLGTTPGIPFRAGLVVDRDDPNNTGANPRLGAPREYFSFYAYLGEWSTNGLSLPSQGVTGTYADEWCDGATEGVFFGVNCDADEWNLNEVDDSPQQVPNGVLQFAVPGSPYNLRDIDCYDSTFQGIEGDCATQPLPEPAKDVETQE